MSLPPCIYDSPTSRGPLGSPLLEGEGGGEVWSVSGEVSHLTLSLSFQEREPVAPRVEPSSRDRTAVEQRSESRRSLGEEAEAGMTPPSRT